MNKKDDPVKTTLTFV